MIDLVQDPIQRHWAKVENGVIVNIIHCHDPALAAELGYTVEVTGTESVIGKPPT